MALWSIAFLGLRPVASLTDGALAGAFGVRVAGVRARVPALLGAALALRLAARAVTTLGDRAPRRPPAVPPRLSPGAAGRRSRRRRRRRRHSVPAPGAGERCSTRAAAGRSSSTVTRRARLHLVGGSWQPDASGAVKISILGPTRQSSAAAIPQVAAELSSRHRSRRLGALGRRDRAEHEGRRTDAEPRHDLRRARDARSRGARTSPWPTGAPRRHATAVAWSFHVS